jgi:Leucine-rich repeat (LRR) protein
MNTELIELNCNDTNIKKLDLLNNTKLERLQCVNNKLGKLDLSNNTELTDLCCWGCELTELNISNNTKLEWINCSLNYLKTLDVSSKSSLHYLECVENSIRGEEMDKLVNALPQQEDAEFRVVSIHTIWYPEKNVCTTGQVAIARAKGWKVLDADGNEYQGSDDSGITSISVKNKIAKEIYSLDGKRHNMLRKGINIIRTNDNSTRKMIAR